MDKRTSNSGPVVLPNATRPERWERKLGVVTTIATVIGIVAWVLYAQNSSNRTRRLASPSMSEFAATAVNRASAPDEAPEGMVWIPGGEFSMGANDLPEVDAVGMKATEDARPIHRVYVDGFLMDKTDVTNAQFTNFVRATRYITVAERKPRAGDFPAAPAENLVAGSVVFSPPGHAVSLDDNFPRVSVGKASIEGEMLDSQSGERVVAFVTSKSGGRRWFSGTSAYKKWADIEAAFRSWAKNFRERLDEAHGA